MSKRLIKLIRLLVVFGCLVAFLTNCQGDLSEKPPIHLNPNMDFQSKKKAQQLSLELPKGTVAFGYKSVNESKRKEFLPRNEILYKGTKDGKYIDRVPLKVTKEMLKRGQKNYNIFCAVCHDRVGTSQSIIIKKGVGIPPPPNLSEEPRLKAMTDGELFSIISVGIRNMPGYSVQIAPEDRWAIVTYVRALQMARSAKIDDVPSNKRTSLK